MFKRTISSILLACLSISIFNVTFDFNNVVFANEAGQEYYVSATNGNDSTGDGTLNNPWKTIQMAADVLQAGDTCVIREGTYRETIIPANSGETGKPIKFQGYAGETATISGTVPITNWQQHSGNIYKVNIPSHLNLGKNNQLFSNSKMMTEARWPNDTDGDPFTFEGFDMEETDGTFIKASTLTQQDGYWNGATLVYGSGSNNAVRSVLVTNYSQQEKKLSYNAEGSPKPRVDTKVFLIGKLEELDSAGEWFYDEGTSTLYFWAPNNASPNDINVEIKNKKYAFNFSDRSHIEISNINIFGSTIYGNNTNSITIDRINAKYIIHKSSAGPLNTWKEELPRGITLIGNNNTIKNSEIAHSAFGGLDINGANIRIVNNLIHHINYNGCSVGAMWLEGRDYLISHNTVHTTSRAILGIYELQKSVIQYNRLYNGGIMGNDFGLINNAKIDGWNTEIHHNLIYENVGTHVPVGIYLDNQHSNFILHHNVVWGINPNVIKNNALRLNIESFNTLLYNNTFIGGFADQYGGTTCENIMTGDRMANNIFTTAFNDHPDIVKSNNIYPDVEPKFVDAANNNYRLSSTSPAIDAGIGIKGVTDGYKGKAPDIGAFEYGGEDWTVNVGYNFDNPPNPQLVFTDYLYMNRVKNAGFDEKIWLEEKGDGLSEWTKTGTGTASIYVYPNNPSGVVKANRNTNTSYCGLTLGSGQNGVEQVITGLTPNTTYNLAGWIKADGGEEIRIGIKDFGGNEKYESTTSSIWQNKNVSFITGATNTSVTVYLWKESDGSGNAYADDISLIYSDEVNVAKEIIIDNTDSGFSSDSPWTTGTKSKGYLGKDYVTAEKDHTKWVKWTPDITEGGEYDIYIRWTSGANRPNAVPIEIAYNGGVDKTKTVNQQENNGVWVLLGRCNLSQGTSNYVKMFCAPTGVTIADAVKFVPASQIEDEKPNDAEAREGNKVKVNGQLLALDVEPIIVDGRMMVPLRAIFEALNATVEWREETRTVIAKKGNIAISLTIDNKIASVNHKNVELDVPAMLVNSRTLVPIRFISESLGAQVDWDEATTTAIITASEKDEIIDPNTAEGIVVDNEDKGFSVDTPWKVDTKTKGFYGENYVTDGTSSADSTKWAKWTPEFVESAEYDVYMKWTAASNRPDAAPIEIAYDGGVDKTKTVNQRENNGVWVFIGRYSFSKGIFNYVKLLATSEGYTVADAVKFIMVKN